MLKIVQVVGLRRCIALQTRFFAKDLDHFIPEINIKQELKTDLLPPKVKTRAKKTKADRSDTESLIMQHMSLSEEEAPTENSVART